jgi:uncharacterized protein
LLAAPIAAWLVQKITARVLGASVGGLILLTNARTMFDAFEVAGRVRAPVYAAISVVWVLALALVVRHHRRAGIPLMNRRARPVAESAQ